MNTELLFNLYAIHSPSGREEKMRNFVMRYIENNCGDVYVEQDAKGNLLCTKGEGVTYPCLAAHLDQVQRFHADDFSVITDGRVCFGYSAKEHEQQGLGADDKNGIFICLECLRTCDLLKVAFFVEEETGRGGSDVVDLSFFSDCRFIVQPDRMGGEDLITSMFCGSVCSEDFEKAVGAEAFGYEPQRGSITDVGTLVERGVGISCLNVSCGYYRPHSDEEFTDLLELENCLHFVENIIYTCTDVYPFEYVGMWSSCYKGSSFGHTWNTWPYKDDFEETNDYYSEGYYDADYDTMKMLITAEPFKHFDELVAEYSCNFFTKDMDTLSIIYDDVLYDMRWESQKKEESGTLFEKTYITGKKAS